MNSSSLNSLLAELLAELWCYKEFKFNLCSDSWKDLFQFWPYSVTQGEATLSLGKRFQKPIRADQSGGCRFHPTENIFIASEASLLRKLSLILLT